jgi:hypothetical protein
METETPPRSDDGSPHAAVAEEPSPTSAGPAQSEAQLMAPVMKARVNSNGGASGTAAATAHAQPYLADNPRFAEFNTALDAGNGAEAMAAANKLLAELQFEKPSNTELLNQARMGLAAGAMMAGQMDEARKALLSIPGKSLKGADREQYDELRDLLKDAYRGLYSTAFQADAAPDAQVQDRGKTAAGHARSLLEFLQKTEPGKTAEIDETRLKLANALLMGGHYRDAEKAVAGVNQSRLAPEQGEFLNAIHQEIHAQQVVALGAAYGYDIKHGRYRQAVENATAVVNNLAKYFPDSKTQIMAARLDQSTAQLKSGDLRGARKSLGRVTQEEFQAAPKELQHHYKELDGQIDQASKDRFERADMQNQLETVRRLVEYGDKDTKNDAVAQAQKLLAELQKNHPDQTERIEGMKLTVADVMLAAGDAKGAAGLAKEVAGATDDSAVKDQAEMLQAQAALRNKPPQTDNAARMLRSLVETGSTPETRKDAKDMLISVESDYVNTIATKADQESNHLWELKKNHFDDVGMEDAPRIQDPHREATNTLSHISDGSRLAMSVMKTNGLTVAELETMDVHQLATLPGVRTEADAKLLRRTLNMSDMSAIGKGDFQGRKFSWDQGVPYVDPSYLDTAGQAAAKWIGKQVRAARAEEEVLKHSDTWIVRKYGALAAGALDGISAANSFVKEKIDVAYDFYQRQGGVLGKVGMAATFVADMGASTVTMPATIIDYKATDEERGRAIQGTLLMAATAGLLKMGGPALSDALGAAGKGIARSRLGQRVAESWVGDAARWTAAQAKAFEGTRLAKGVDAVTDTLGKINRFGRPKATTTGGAATGGDSAKAAGAATTDAADTLNLPKTEGNAPMDAADTLDMPAVDDGSTTTGASGATAGANPASVQGRGVEKVVDEVVGDKTAEELRASITPQEVKTLEGKLIKDEYKKLLSAKKRELTRTGQNLSEAGQKLSDRELTKKAADKIRNEYPGEKLRDHLRQLMRKEFSEQDVQRIVLGKHIYNEAYHGQIEYKPAHITQGEYEEDLALSKGRQTGVNRWESTDGKSRIFEDDYWRHRASNIDGKVGLDASKVESGADVRRFYFNIRPDKAAEFADQLAKGLNAEKVKWQFKMPKELEEFDRPDSGVLYVDKADYQAAKKIVMDYAEQHPEAFAEGTPSFTKHLSSGIGVAEEPLQQGLPKTRKGKHSFGSSRSDIIADAIVKAPPEATRKEIMALVRERLKECGLDPDRPWLSRADGVDDL